MIGESAHIFSEGEINTAKLELGLKPQKCLISPPSSSLNNLLGESDFSKDIYYVQLS